MEYVARRREDAFALSRLQAAGFVDQAAAPNEKWLTDITEFQIPAGKVYLSPMIDCFDGLAWLAIEDRRSETDSLDVAQGVLTGQRCMRRLLLDLDPHLGDGGAPVADFKADFA